MTTRAPRSPTCPCCPRTSTPWNGPAPTAAMRTVSFSLSWEVSDGWLNRSNSLAQRETARRSHAEAFLCNVWQMQTNSGCTFFMCYIITTQSLCDFTHHKSTWFLLKMHLTRTKNALSLHLASCRCLYLVFVFQGCVSCLCLNWRRRWRKWRRPSSVTAKS